MDGCIDQPRRRSRMRKFMQRGRESWGVHILFYGVAEGMLEDGESTLNCMSAE
ncbi:predicted protein [Sclerotinia sclerotiorum 1980 UF-70]|uniref:Uncharacterized protein n=1 Tax=Sclerotinia sclerotiorum (strain ATCC 18683 / 1980 / Ss-1) TaxID=665079 RepID=A7EHK6_SCLS1|nr:predicted protein [Sclerotinia sclerotiorum 1980 UF-70]EDO02322.1 predicted protein [Sclerotinia sclerotiorum 1980 UF-70]